MKRIKGFTLIEIIVSMAVIGILAVGMLPVMSGGLVFLNKSKEITQNVFNTQREMELAIESAKAGASGLSPKTLTLFPGHDIEVSYYEVTYDNNGKKYSTMVSTTRPPEHDMLALSGVQAVANNDSTLKTVSSTTGNFIEARHDPVYEPDYFRTVYQWYASREGFNIPHPGGIVPEDEVGTVFPAFPYDYEPLPFNFDTKLLSDLTKYKGKHIVFTATPASLSGKLGTVSLSNAIFVGDTILPDKLLVKLDASLIDEFDSGQVRSASGSSYVKLWNNQIEPTRNATEDTSSQQPKVEKNAPQTDFVGKYVDFDSNKRLEIENYYALRNKPLSLYMVVRGNANSVIEHSNTTIHVQDEGTNPNNAVIVHIGNGWKIAKKNYTTLNNNPAEGLTIGNVDLDVAELLVYALLNATEEQDVINHLIDKYRLYTPNENISKLHDFSDEIFRNEAYELPDTVLATFEDGNTSYVPVTWTDLTYAPGGIVDTTVVRTLNFNGVATNDTSKKVRFRLVIKPVTELTSVTIDSITQPLEIDDELTLTYTFQPNHATIQTLKWSSSDPSVASIDTKTGLLKALKNGKTMITVEANGLTSLSYEVSVGVEAPPPVSYLREWNFETDTQGWNESNIENFRSSSGVLTGESTTYQESYLYINSLDMPVNESSKIVVRIKNNSDATQFRVRFRNTTGSWYNEYFIISANDTTYKEYLFDMSSIGAWANRNLDRLRMYPIYNDRNETFEIDYIKITD